MPRQIVGSSSTSRATAVGAPSNRPLSVRNGCAQSVLSRRKNNWPAANTAWLRLRITCCGGRCELSVPMKIALWSGSPGFGVSVAR